MWLLARYRERARRRQASSRGRSSRSPVISLTHRVMAPSSMEVSVAVRSTAQGSANSGRAVIVEITDPVPDFPRQRAGCVMRPVWVYIDCDIGLSHQPRAGGRHEKGGAPASFPPSIT